MTPKILEKLQKKIGGAGCMTLPSFLSPFPPPFPFLPLEVGPLNPARGMGSAVSSPSRVWGGAPAEIEFGAF